MTGAVDRDALRADLAEFYGPRPARNLTVTVGLRLRLIAAVPALLDALDAAEAKIAAVREMHLANRHYPYYCVKCRLPLPCSTLRAMGGEQP